MAQIENLPNKYQKLVQNLLRGKAAKPQKIINMHRYISEDFYEDSAIERGGFESRDVTIDYAKMGTKIRGLNQLVAFYNARLQGYAKVYDAFVKRPGRASLLITGGIILPSIYFWFANK
mgnify:CR=1 FL=1